VLACCFQLHLSFGLISTQMKIRVVPRKARNVDIDETSSGLRWKNKEAGEAQCHVNFLSKKMTHKHKDGYWKMSFVTAREREEMSGRDRDENIKMLISAATAAAVVVVCMAAVAEVALKRVKARTCVKPLQVGDVTAALPPKRNLRDIHHHRTLMSACMRGARTAVTRGRFHRSEGEV